MIIGYLRVSTEKQIPEIQRDEIRRFAEEKSFVVDTWVVETVSGKQPYRKRKLGRRLRTMKRGDTLIVTEISRLSRSLTEIMTIMGSCLEKGICIYTTKERYTFDNSINSKVLCFAFGLVAEIERNLISMRTKEALALKRAEGLHLGRRAGSDVKMQVIRDNSARIDAMLAAGMPVTKICRKIGISRNTWYKFQSQRRA
ncbi:MAG: recombinase family protein [Clostridia bacterium]|nr:recombinase family protein [Clostridia bacterium]